MSRIVYVQRARSVCVQTERERESRYQAQICTENFQLKLTSISKANDVVACSVISDSSRPRGLQPARLLCPWNFSGKNTFPISGDLHDSLASPALAGGFFNTAPPGNPKLMMGKVKSEYAHSFKERLYY